MEHIFEGHRCRFCNVNVLDDELYGPFKCADRDPLTYTTESETTE